MKVIGAGFVMAVVLAMAPANSVLVVQDTIFKEEFVF